MPPRARWTDRILARIATAHAQHVYRRFVAATKHATAMQEQVLLAKIRRNADSDFGRAHHFERIHSASDFVRMLPILRYADHQPYIERVKAGDLRAMFGGRQRVHMFALSSGTVDEPKCIPVTGHFLDEYRRGWNAFGIKALMDHPKAILRGIAQVSSRMDESRTSAGIPCGAITGLMAATQKRLVRKYYLTPRCLAEIDDPQAKYYAIVRLTVPRDAAFLITASPATQLKLAKTADQHKERLIREIHDGTLWPELPISANIREALRPLLRADPVAARRLEQIARQHGRLLPKHYWDIALLANWTGGTMSLYLQDYPEYFGDAPLRDVGLLASEGRVTIPVEDDTPAGVLEVTGQFFEFVPTDRMEEASPRAFLSHQLEVGQEYFVLMTTSSGLYRYDLGDVVRVVGYLHQAPILEFLNKGARTCSLTGEKLTERQVILAMERAAKACGQGLAHFVLCPAWADPPYYVLHIESCDSDRLPFSRGPQVRADLRSAAKPEDVVHGGDPGSDSGALAAAMDRALGEINIEYAGKRQSLRLGAVRPNLLPAGFLADLDRRESERYRRSNEQYKHQYLYTRPGQDADWPTADHGGVAKNVYENLFYEPRP